MKYNIKKRKTSKDLDYSNSSRVFRPLASRTCLSNVLNQVKNVFSRLVGVNCMSV